MHVCHIPKPGSCLGCSNIRKNGAVGMHEQREEQWKMRSGSYQEPGHDEVQNRFYVVETSGTETLSRRVSDWPILDSENSCSPLTFLSLPGSGMLGQSSTPSPHSPCFYSVLHSTVYQAQKWFSVHKLSPSKTRLVHYGFLLHLSFCVFFCIIFCGCL